MTKTEKENLCSFMCDDTFPRFPIRKSELDRFKFGKKWYYEIANLDGDKAPFCLDVACGAKPFPKAHVLCDLYLKPVPDRSMKGLVTGGKPFVLCDCRFLPFRDKAFDFVTCYYLIEHINDPRSLFKELKRVSKHGYIQSPSWFNEILYGEKVHNWIVIKRGDELYVKPVNNGRRFNVHFGFVFHKLYRFCRWQILHAILDETLHLFTVRYMF
jgi:SAM-dependent methyltransferase